MEPDQALALEKERMEDAGKRAHLLRYAAKGNTKAIRALLEEHRPHLRPALLDTPDQDGRAVLFQCITPGHHTRTKQHTTTHHHRTTQANLENSVS
jgi:hypothetical protein